MVLSHGFVESFRRYTGLRYTPKLNVIGNPITVPNVVNIDLMSKKKQILYVGRMDKENKRVNRIVDAWEVLFKDYPEWRLALVGGGPHLEELKAYVSSRGIMRVEFTGFLNDDPIGYYCDSSIFMLASDLEGFGLVLVEAMSFGVVPVVYGGYATVFDIVDNGKNGIITPTPYSKETTVAALRGLMDDDGLRMKMAVDAIAKSKKFSVNSIVEQWQTLFNRIK